MQYDDNREFNEYLDRTYGTITIEDFSNPASFVLFEMDEQEYINAYNLYINRQKEVTLEKVKEVFPAPIAFYYDKAVHDYDHPYQRLNLLRSTWESIIFFLYALVIGEVIDSSFSLSLIRIFNNQPVHCNRNGLLSDRLGCKLEIIEKILRFNSQGNCNLVVSDLIPLSVVDSLKELQDSRNSISHRVGGLSNEQAQTFFEQLHPKVQDIIFELRKLEYFSLLRYKYNNDSITSIIFSKFKGHSLQGRNYEKNVDSVFISKNIANLRTDYLFCEFEEHNKIICLSPFACTREHNGRHHIAWYKRLGTSADQYLFEIVSDSSDEISLDRNTFEKPIEALGALL